MLFVGKESQYILVDKLNAMEGDAILHDIFARLGELVTLQATTKYENAKATDLQKEVTGHLNRRFSR